MTETEQEYNFRKPNRIPKEQIKTIHLIHENYGETISQSLSAFLCSEASVTLKQVEQVTFEEYLLSLSNPTCIGSFDMQPLSGFGTIEVNSVLIYMMIDKMLGGEGNPPSIARSFTDLELSLTRKLLNMLLEKLSESWSQILSISFGLKEIQTNPNPAFVRVISNKEACLAIYLKASVGATTGMMTICIPYATLEPIAGNFRDDQANHFQAKLSDEAETTRQQNFHRIPLDVDVILGKIPLTMEEVLQLQPGDILNTEQKTRNPVEVRIANTPKFFGSPGLVGKYKGVTIQNEISKE